MSYEAKIIGNNFTDYESMTVMRNKLNNQQLVVACVREYPL